jgi:hypothetical protein
VLPAQVLLTSLAGLLLLACDDKPTESKFELNTNPRSHESRFNVQRWDSETREWSYTTDSAPVHITWRFLSSSEQSDGGHILAAGFVLDWENPNSEEVTIRVGHLTLYDISGIPMAEHDLVPDLEFPIEANGSRTRNGNFEFSVQDLEITEQVVRMGVFGSVSYIP